MKKKFWGVNYSFKNVQSQCVYLHSTNGFQCSLSYQDSELFIL